MLEWPDVRHDGTKGGAGGTACHPGSESVSERRRNGPAIRFYDYDERPLHSAPPGRRYDNGEVISNSYREKTGETTVVLMSN
jgi:hypothetical protein